MMMDIELLPCGLCGEKEGYNLSEGSTFRWWDIICNACGRAIDECRSDGNHKVNTPIPERSEGADVTWNEAAGYAEELRQQLAEQSKAEAELENALYVAEDVLQFHGLITVYERNLKRLTKQPIPQEVVADMYWDEEENFANTLYDLAQLIAMSDPENGEVFTVYKGKSLGEENMKMVETDIGGWELQTLSSKPESLK